MQKGRLPYLLKQYLDNRITAEEWDELQLHLTNEDSSDALQTALETLIGRSPADVDLAGYPGVALIAVEDHAGSSVLGEVHDDDVLVVTGPPSEGTHFALAEGLAAHMTGSADSADLLTREGGVAEVVVPPRSRLVGETCDMRVSIPMTGDTESLNAGVAAAVTLAEIARRRRSSR